MNQAQEKSLAWLKIEILRHDGLQNVSDKYEYKRWDIDESESTNLIFLISEVGLKDDEGTMAEMYARKRRHICIGLKGGLKLINARNRSTAIGRRVVWELTR